MGDFTVDFRGTCVNSVYQKIRTCMLDYYDVALKELLNMPYMEYTNVTSLDRFEPH